LSADEAGAGLRGRGKLGALWVWDEAVAGPRMRAEPAQASPLCIWRVRIGRASAGQRLWS